MSRKPDFEADRDILLYLRSLPDGDLASGNHPQAIWKALKPTKHLARSTVFNTINRLVATGLISVARVPHEYKRGRRLDTSGTPMVRINCQLTAKGRDLTDRWTSDSED